MIEVGKTMTTEEYLKKKEQEDIDKLFDEATKQSKLRNDYIKKEVAKEQKFQELLRQLGDVEAELGISIDLYNEGKNSSSKTADEIKAMEQDIKTYKQRHTRILNEVNKYIKLEEDTKKWIME